jgi:hypothetical protein
VTNRAETFVGEIDLICYSFDLFGSLLGVVDVSWERYSGL